MQTETQPDHVWMYICIDMYIYVILKIQNYFIKFLLFACIILYSQ